MCILVTVGTINVVSVKGLSGKKQGSQAVTFPMTYFQSYHINKLSPTLNLQISTELIKYYFLNFCEKGNNPSSWGGNE